MSSLSGKTALVTEIRKAGGRADAIAARRSCDRAATTASASFTPLL